MFQRNNTKSLGSRSSASSKSAILIVIILTLVTLQRPLKQFYLFEEKSKENATKLEADMHAQQQYMYNQRRALINESSAFNLGFSSEALPSGSWFIQHYFGSEIGTVESWRVVSSSNETVTSAYLKEFANPAVGDLLFGNVCDTIQLFRKTNGVRRHVLISHLNENWGAFSTTVLNRTVDWGDWEGHFKRDGCTTEDLWWYLNHTNVSAVFTVTHQWLEHPKIFSLPLGIKSRGQIEIISQELDLEGKTFNNRTELLLIAQSESLHRQLIAKHVIANFNGTIRNQYNDGSDYWQNLREAKFILSPSGLGWDCYRTWEALCLGAIPC